MFGGRCSVVVGVAAVVVVTAKAKEVPGTCWVVGDIVGTK
jgi:hypothetical protein